MLPDSIEKVEAQCWDAIGEACEEWAKEHLHPLCRRFKLRFIQGNGTWLLEGQTGRHWYGASTSGPAEAELYVSGEGQSYFPIHQGALLDALENILPQLEAECLGLPVFCHLKDYNGQATDESENSNQAKGDKNE